MSLNQLVPCTHKLIPFARWVTPVVEKRRFDTFFYVAGVEKRPSSAEDAEEKAKEKGEGDLADLPTVSGTSVGEDFHARTHARTHNLSHRALAW